ncbi:hypothetical protein [Brevibacillus sp. H7]|uniref:hypothetical protein n=1 Tax=Brevibacillus sp. H7 TaxID=3349138 RepID=UPI0038208E0F
MFSVEGRNRDEVISEASQEAKQKAIDAGADPSTVELINLEEVPIAYVPSNVIRMKAKAAGTLKIEAEEIPLKCPMSQPS